MVVGWLRQSSLTLTFLSTSSIPLSLSVMEFIQVEFLQIVLAMYLAQRDDLSLHVMA
jgi:hypothetical protein